MNNLLVSPHDDDFALFAAFTCLREQPVIMIVFDSYLQEKRGLPITHMQRAKETLAASVELGNLPVVRLGFRDDDPTVTPEAIQQRAAHVMMALKTDRICAAPAYERGGHDQHNLVASAFEKTTVKERYLTYTREPCQKSTDGQEVPILDHRWIGIKLRALACFESQFQAATGCAEHFIGRSLREYYR